MKNAQLAKAANALKQLEKDIESKRSTQANQITSLRKEIGEALIHQQIGFESADIEALRQDLRQAEEKMDELDMIKAGLPGVLNEIREHAFHLHDLTENYLSLKERYLKTRSQDPVKAKAMMSQLRESAETAEMEADFNKTITEAIQRESENRQRAEFDVMLKQLANTPERLEDKDFMEKIENYAGRFKARQRLKEVRASAQFVNPVRKVAG